MSASKKRKRKRRALPTHAPKVLTRIYNPIVAPKASIRGKLKARLGPKQQLLRSLPFVSESRYLRRLKNQAEALLARQTVISPPQNMRKKCKRRPDRTRSRGSGAKQRGFIPWCT